MPQWNRHSLLQLDAKGAGLKERVQGKIIEHKQYIGKNGNDLPEIPNSE